MNMNQVGVYILKCSNTRYYIGSTNHLDRRVNEHQRGLVKATQYVLPVVLVFFQPCTTLTAARKLEYRLKAKKSKVIIDAIIREGFIKFKAN